MENNNQMFKKGHRIWWMSLLIGLLSVAMGVLCFTSPWGSLAAMSILFVAIFLGMGAANIIQAIANRHYDSQWGWDLAAGIIELLLGIWLLTMPMPQIMETMIYVFAFWLMFSSVMGIGRAVVLSRVRGSGWGWMLLLNILVLIASFIFLISPAFAGMNLLILAGIGFIFYGCFRIALAFKVR